MMGKDLSSDGRPITQDAEGRVETGGAGNVQPPRSTLPQATEQWQYVTMGMPLMAPPLGHGSQQRSTSGLEERHYQEQAAVRHHEQQHATALHRQIDPASQRLHEQIQPSAQHLHERTQPSAQRLHERTQPSTQHLHERTQPSAQRLHEQIQPSAQHLHEQIQPATQHLHERRQHAPQRRNEQIHPAMHHPHEQVQTAAQPLHEQVQPPAQGHDEGQSSGVHHTQVQGHILYPASLPDHLQRPGSQMTRFRGHLIPNIVIEPIPPRDAYGHSHTPPFVQNPQHKRGCIFALGLPGNGEKVRALSDSSILNLEKDEAHSLRYRQHIPTHEFHTAHEFHPPASEQLTEEPKESSIRDQQPTTYRRGPSLGHTRRQGFPCRQDEPLTFRFPEPDSKLSSLSIPSPMEVDNGSSQKTTPDQHMSEEESPYSDAARDSAATSQPRDIPQSVPSVTHFHTPEKSPKMYWLRRHSDSNVPSAPSAEEGLKVLGDDSLRSQSTGDADSIEKTSPGSSMDEGGPSLSTRSQPISVSASAAGTHSSTIARSPDGHSPGHKKFTELIKLKKYLQKRYQSSLDEDLGLKEVKTDAPDTKPAIDTISTTTTTQPDTTSTTPTPDIQRQVSSGFVVRSQKGRRMAYSEGHEDEVAQEHGGPSDQGHAMAPPNKRPPRLSLQETKPLKVEPISPTGSDNEPETPVFFSPSFISPRVFSDSPRWHHGVFQFPVSRGRQVSPLSIETRVPPVCEDTRRGQFVGGFGVHSSPSMSEVKQPEGYQPVSGDPVVRDSPESIATGAGHVAGDEEAMDEGDRVRDRGYLHVDVEPQAAEDLSLRGASAAEAVSYSSPYSVELQQSPHLSPSPYHMSGIVTRGHRAIGRSRSEGHMPSRPLSPILQGRQSSPPVSGSHSLPASSYLPRQGAGQFLSCAEPEAAPSEMSPLPPFSMIRQHPSLPHSQLSPGPFSSQPRGPGTPFSSYTVSSPSLSPLAMSQWSPATTSHHGAPVALSPERESTGQPPPPSYQALHSPTRSSPSGPPTPTSTSHRTDASKLIYCPFGDKIREQRLSQDPSSVFRCPVCSQLFPSYYYLANHMVNHLPSEVVSKGPGDSNKVHLCKVCNRAFSRSDMLTRHMRLHTGLKPYECRTCGQVFSRSDHLHTHRRTHTGEKPYKCPQCPYAAPRRDMITRHMRIHVKHFTRRGRRTSSTSSDITPQSSTESVDVVKRRNQSLSSIDSLESDHSFRHSSMTSTDLDHPGTLLEEDITKGRNWSITSGDSIESTSDIIPSSTDSRNWSVTSGESMESYSAASPGGLQPETEETSPSTSVLSTDTISAEVQTSFQKCTVASDKDNSNSSSDKDVNLSPASVTMDDTPQRDSQQHQ